MANATEMSNKISFVSECYVKPKYETKDTKNTHFLGPDDISFLPLEQIQSGLLFSTKPKNMQSFLGELNESLSISLVDFYPLAGQLVTETFAGEQANLVYVDCSRGLGARIIHAIVEEVVVSDILCSIDVPIIVRSLFDLGVEAINYDGHNRPLLSIQLTELVNGLFVAFTMNHSLGDGNSLWRFISTLSEVHAQLMENIESDDIVIPRKPVFVTYFPDGCGPVLKSPYIDIDKSITQCNNAVALRERIFHFPSKSISNLKAKANEECGVNNISSFQALSGFMWRSITRARNLQPEFETCCALVMNARPRLIPPFSDDYFGNYIVRQQSLCTVGELLDNGFGYAAMLVHQLVAAQNDKTIREFFKMLVKFLSDMAQNGDCMGSPFYSPELVIIGGSTRFDMYRPEFGLGKAKAVLNGYSSREDGKIFASPGHRGDGSVYLEVCLKPEAMNALELNEEFMSLVSLD